MPFEMADNSFKCISEFETSVKPSQLNDLITLQFVAKKSDVSTNLLWHHSEIFTLKEYRKKNKCKVLDELHPF